MLYMSTALFVRKWLLWGIFIDCIDRRTIKDTLICFNYWLVSGFVCLMAEKSVNLHANIEYKIIDNTDLD